MMLSLLRRNGKGPLIGPAMLAVVVLAAGCATRESDADRMTLPDNVVRANSALTRAEEAMAAAGVSIDFDDLSRLSDLRDTLPDPTTLATPEVRANVESAVGDFYSVLDEMNVEIDDMNVEPFRAPAQFEDVRLSATDESLINLYLSYLYSLDAVSRLAEAGGDLFNVEFPRDLSSGDVYQFALNIDVAGLEPDEVIALFNVRQRQAVVDAIRLLVGGTVVAGSQRPAINEALFRRSALFHLNQARAIITEISPEIRQALDDLDVTLKERLALDILARLERWGFVIEELPLELRPLITPLTQ